jgi:type VII secretion-associated serine protease mycosin
MTARIVRTALVGAVTALSAVPVAAAPADAADHLTAPGHHTVTAPAPCAAPAVPATVVTDEPWAQKRYLPERLEPLTTGGGVVVAVIDSGVDRQHPQLRTRVLPGADFLDPGGDGSRDCAGHGTAVASIIAASVRKGVPFHGLAPDARILPVRVSEQQVIDGKESGRAVTTAQFAQAIRWAVDHGAGVLNLSVVLYQDDPAVRDAVGYAVDRDVVVVAAAGNLHDEKHPDGSGDPRPYPAAYPNVIGVGAIDETGLRSRFSQVGSYVDVVAPGGAVLAAATGQGHRGNDGTSYATPFVAATAALLRQYQPRLTARQVADRITRTADPAPVAERGGYGSGVLNPYRAVTETGAAERQPAPAAAPATGPDPAALALAARRARARQTAAWVAVGAGGAAGLTVLGAVALPRAARRRWRPGDPD